jgi:hypothetical protein
MVSILGSKITPPNQDGNEEGCFCNIKAKKIYGSVKKRGFEDYGNPPDYLKPPTIYLKRIRKGSGEESDSGPSPCQDGNPISWSASTQYTIVDEYNPRSSKFEITECSGNTQKNGSLGGCICYGIGSFTGAFNGKATLSIKEDEFGEKKCEWDGSYTYDKNCLGGPSTGKVSSPLTSVNEKVTYENKFDYQILQDLMRELFEKCKFDDDDFKWNHKREVRFEITNDGSNVEAICKKPEGLFQDIWDSKKNDYRCMPCYELEYRPDYGFEFLNRKLTVEFYTDKREEEERTWIQQSKVQFVPKTEHYWKVFVPQLFVKNAETYEVENYDDFPIFCELVKAIPGKIIEIDPPKEPGYYIIMNFAKKYDLSHLALDNEGKLVGCMEKKNFPKILQHL